VGATVAQAALQAIQGRAPVASGLGFAAIEVGLPRAEADAAVPGFLRRPAANVLDAVSPRTAELAIVRLPGLTLLFLPAEATVEAARILRERVAALAAKDESIAVVSLAQGYIGYAESPAAVRAGRGEAKRSLFEPELLERLAQGLAAGMEATRAAEAKRGPP